MPDTDQNSVRRILLGAAIALITSLASQLPWQWFQLAKQQSFERAQTVRQEQFQREQTLRQEQFQEQSTKAQETFQHNEAQSAAQRVKSDRAMTALESYASAYIKGSTQLLIHMGQLTPDIAKLMEQPAPSYEAVLDVANRYEQLIKEITDLLGESGPRQSLVEILAGRKGPSGEFRLNYGMPGFVDRNDIQKRKDLLLTMQRYVGQLQTDVLRNVKASTAFMDKVQKTLSEEPAKNIP